MQKNIIFGLLILLSNLLSAQMTKIDSINILRDAIFYDALEWLIYPNNYEKYVKKAYHIHKLYNISPILDIYMDSISINKSKFSKEELEEAFSVLDSFIILPIVVDLEKRVIDIQHQLDVEGKRDSSFYAIEVFFKQTSKDTVLVFIGPLAYNIYNSKNPTELGNVIDGPYQDNGHRHYTFVKRRRYWEWVPHNRSFKK